MEQGTMHQATITAEADGQRITATATEGRGIILNASKVGSISLQIDVHIDGPELRDLLHGVRERGYALEDNLITEGLASVGVPVLDRTGYPVAGISVTFEAVRVDPERRARLVEAVQRAASTLTRRLGG